MRRRGIESSFCKAAMARSGSPVPRLPGRGSRSERDPLTRLSRWDHRHSPFDQSQCGGFVTETHIDQREITNQNRIFRLFFEEKFQFAARLSPSFLGGGMLAGNLLRPA